MTHFWSGLVSWMNLGSEDRRQAEFEKWAKTEYKKDWKFAYNHMLATNGKPPQTNYTPEQFSKKEAA
tara:strand:+ start:211 stop:411 length:201 start_codon:yes stop_codon:yes gene_type:complete